MKLTIIFIAALFSAEASQIASQKSSGGPSTRAVTKCGTQHELPILSSPTSGKQVGTLRCGENIIVLNKNAVWAEIRTTRHEWGYVALLFITEIGPYIPILSSYDKFKDITFVKTEDMFLTNSDFRFKIFYTCKGNVENCHPSSLGILFSSRTSGWKFMKRTRSVIFLVDDARLSLGEADWDGEALADGVLEQMTIYISPAQLATIAGGRKVEGEVATTAFSISADTIVILQELLKKISE